MTEAAPSPAGSRFRWLLAGRGRIACGLLAGGLCALATFRLPAEMRMIISFDAAGLVYVVLFCIRIAQRESERDGLRASRDELHGVATLVAVVVLAIMSVVAVAALLNNLAQAPYWLNVIHIATSLLAIVLAWLLTHIFFGLHYMALYYANTNLGDGATHDRGLEFRDRADAGYWEFMYHAFTIGMCFGTTDVAVTSTAMRRVSLLHAIFSFFFVAAIIGFVVNILSGLA